MTHLILYQNKEQ